MVTEISPVFTNGAASHTERTFDLQTTDLENLGMRNYPEVFHVVNGLFAELDDEQLHNVGRWSFNDNQGNTTFIMPGETPGPNGIKGIKIIQSHEPNRLRGLPRSISTLTLYDKETGQVITQMDSTELTPVKSACESAVILSMWEKVNQPKSIRLGVFGGGPNAKEHIEAFLRLSNIPIEIVQIFSPRQSGKLLATKLKSKHPEKEISFNTSRRNIMETSNVVVLATTSPTSLLTAEHLNNDVRNPKLIIGLGFHDIDLSALQKSDLVIIDDPKEYIKTDLPVGQHLKMLPTNTATLSKVIHSPHLGANRTTIFAPFGLGVVDVAVAHHLYKNTGFNNNH